MNSNENSNFKSILLEIDKKFSCTDKKVSTAGVDISKYVENRLNRVLEQYETSLANACESLEMHNEAKVIKRMKNNKEVN
jgi:hypothetical protein